jgi:hypothetical protein
MRQAQMRSESPNQGAYSRAAAISTAIVLMPATKTSAFRVYSWLRIRFPRSQNVLRVTVAEPFTRMVSQAVMHHAVAERRGAHQPSLGFADV